MGGLKEEAEKIAAKVAKATGQRPRDVLEDLFADPEAFATKYEAHLSRFEIELLAGPQVQED